MMGLAMAIIEELSVEVDREVNDTLRLWIVFLFASYTFVPG